MSASKWHGLTLLANHVRHAALMSHAKTEQDSGTRGLAEGDNEDRSRNAAHANSGAPVPLQSVAILSGNGADAPWRAGLAAKQRCTQSNKSAIWAWRWTCKYRESMTTFKDSPPTSTRQWQDAS
jgi:hypothetical protein